MADKRVPSVCAMSRAELEEHLRRYHGFTGITSPSIHHRISATSQPSIRHGHRPMRLSDNPHPDWAGRC